MKSIIQEASSIAKAIEEGWTKAQKPQQFSVKILEEAEKNFLGLTKKSAKVAIFFDEISSKTAEHNTGHVKQVPQRQQVRQAQEKHVMQRQYTQTQKSQPAQTEQTHQQKKQFEPLWNQPMIERAHQWMQDALKYSEKEHIKFTIEPQKFHLRITLSEPVLPDIDKEKQLLASFSALILEALKRSFKISLRGHKIVLTHKI